MQKTMKMMTFPCLCLTCGHTTDPYIEVNSVGLAVTNGKCEVCSDTAYVLSTNRLSHLFKAIATELVSIKDRG
jgi:hypothetical protein